MIKLKNSKSTHLGSNRYALDCSIGAVQMRESEGEWQDIKPRLVEDTEGWHAEGTPYALKILTDGTRTIYPDRTDLGKYIYLPAPAMLHGLPKRIEGNKLIFYTPTFEIAYQLTNTGIQFMILMKAPIPFDRITLDAEAVGLDIDKLLKAKKGLGIPRPRLIDRENVERRLDWSYKAGKLELGFDLSGLKFPILLKNTTIDKDVGVSGDDGYAYNISFVGDSAQLRMGKETAYDIRAFARFTGVTIPADAIIGANCYASFFVWNSTQPGVYLKVSADDSANPNAPTTAAQVFAITPTTAGVDWDDQAAINDWTTLPDIQSVIAELQASYDYSAGAAITIIVDNDGSANNERIIAWSYDYDGLAPKLHIEYTTEAPPVGGGAQNIVMGAGARVVAGGGAQTIMIGFPSS